MDAHFAIGVFGVRFCGRETNVLALVGGPGIAGGAIGAAADAAGRGDGDGYRYLLRWEDLDAFPEATWTSVNHCVGCQDLLDGFLAEQAPKRRKSSTVAYSPAKVCATPQTASRTGAEAAAPESTAEAAPAGRCPGVPFDELIDSVHKFAVCPACRQHGVFSALRFHSFTPTCVAGDL